MSETAARDWSTISPSARAILLVRSQTAPPYAARAAEIVCGAAAVEETRRELASNEAASLRRDHFEARARSIDLALASLAPARILELGSGFSFRGLAQAERRDVEWLDSDLPEVIATKRGVLELIAPRALRGKYWLRALDALDEAKLAAAVGELSAGPLAIVNEGLLMYLDDAEKQRLARAIRRALVERDGAWITADVYVRTARTIFRDERSRRFVQEHGIDQKKFATFEAAETFFVENGFRIAERYPPERDPARARETWVVRPNA